MNPHLAAAPLLLGTPLRECRVALVALHGRGQDPAYLRDHLIDRLVLDDVGVVLPEAAGSTWYPERFMAPPADNEPWLTHALDAADAALDQALAAGVPARRIVLAGFSQGACLAVELLARRPRPLGGAAILTGGLLGPDGQMTTPTGSLEGLAVVLRTSTLDAWVPLSRARETAAALRAAGAIVALDERDDPVHHIDDGDVAAVARLIETAGS